MHLRLLKLNKIWFYSSTVQQNPVSQWLSLVHQAPLLSQQCCCSQRGRSWAHNPICKPELIFLGTNTINKRSALEHKAGLLALTQLWTLLLRLGGGCGPGSAKQVKDKLCSFVSASELLPSLPPCPASCLNPQCVEVSGWHFRNSGC